MQLTAEAHLKADPETGLHDLTDRLVGQMGSDWCQQQSPQDLKQYNDTVLKFRVATIKLILQVYEMTKLKIFRYWNQVILVV